MKIKIATANETERIVEVEAEEIKCIGQSKLRFFIHPSWKVIKELTITEYSSGATCSRGSSRQKCIKLLESRIKSFGEDYFIKNAKDLLRVYGIKYPVNK